MEKILMKTILLGLMMSMEGHDYDPWGAGVEKAHEL